MWIFDGRCSLIFFLFHLFIPARAEIIFSPKDTEASVGENVTIFCSTSSGNCEWYHRSIGTKSHELVYREEYIYNGYKERFRIIMTEDKTCNLLIENVNIKDAGLFTCMEVLDTQTTKLAELIVFEKYPSNESCASKIILNPSFNYMELSCIMKSYGNIRPFMEWRDSGGNLVNSTKDKMQIHTTLSVIHVNEDLSRHLSYNCYVKYPDNFLPSKLHWSYSAPVYLAYKPMDNMQKSCWRTETLFIFSFGSNAVISTIIILFFIWKRMKPQGAPHGNAIEKGHGNAIEEEPMNGGEERGATSRDFSVDIPD